MGILGLVVLGLLAGAVSALCGVGGGIVVVPLLVRLWGFDVKLAIGTSLAMIVPTALVGVARKVPVGQVDFRTAGIVTVGAIFGAVAGSWLVNVLPALWVKRIFAAFLVVMAAQLLLDR